MAAPTLSDAEIAQLQKEALKQQSTIDTLNAAIPAKAARAAELAVADGAFKKFFDYYNDDIIGNYDTEQKALNGIYIVDPITEADIEGPANIDGSVRTTPSLPDTDLIRVTEFDGGGTSSVSITEPSYIADQANIENRLVNGYSSSSGFNPGTAVTTSNLSSASTQVSVTDPSNALTIIVGDFLYFQDGTYFAIAEVTGVTDDMGGDPPYNFTYDISFVSPPAGTISSGVDVDDFTGFSDSDRSSKTASDPNKQLIMDYLISLLEDAVNGRLTKLNEQIPAITANQDPDAVSELAAALLNANTSKTFLTNYLLTTDVSDSGILSLSTERGVRSPQIVSRLIEILANYTGQTENYYDRRYSVANDRGNTARGTLRLQKASEGSSSTLTDYAATAQDALDAINALLS